MFNFEVILILVILVIVLYSIVVYYCKSDKFWDWFNTLIATFLSVFLAFMVGLSLFSYQTKETDKKRKQQLYTLLTNEISSNSDCLNSKNSMEIRIGTITEKVVVTYIQPLIIEEAARSGLFDSSKTKEMLILAQNIHMYNIQVSFLFSVLTAGLSISTPEHVLHAIQNVENSRKIIISNGLNLQNKINLTFPLSEK